MKLLVVSHPCVVDVNQRVYRELELMGHQVAVVVPNRWRHEYSPREFRPVRLEGFTGPLLPLPVSNPGSVALHGYLARLGPILAQVAPDILYIEEEPYSVATFQWSRAAARCKIPMLFFSDQNIAKKYPLPFRLSERYVWGHSLGAICATANIVEALKARGYRGQTFVVPHAVDVGAFAGGHRDGALRNGLGLRSNVIAYLGRLVAEKGIRELLEAYRRLPMRDSTSLLCIGDGPLLPACQAEKGTVVLGGVPHAEVPKYLALADLLVLPSLTTRSWKEQFGRAAIEAMACALPVVGSDSGEIPNVISGTGGGVVVPEGNSAALCDALAWLLSNASARKQLGEQGRKQVEVSYSTSAVASRLATALSLPGEA